MAAHPDIDARISASLRYADFIADDVDVAIRLSNGVHSDLHVEKLFDQLGLRSRVAFDDFDAILELLWHDPVLCA